MKIKILNQSHEVSSIEEAQRLFREIRDSEGREGRGGVRAMGAEFPVTEGRKRLGHVSYNGRWWPADA